MVHAKNSSSLRGSLNIFGLAVVITMLAPSQASAQQASPGADPTPPGESGAQYVLTTLGVTGAAALTTGASVGLINLAFSMHDPCEEDCGPVDVSPGAFLVLFSGVGLYYFGVPAVAGLTADLFGDGTGGYGNENAALVGAFVGSGAVLATGLALRYSDEGSVAHSAGNALALGAPLIGGIPGALFGYYLSDEAPFVPTSMSIAPLEGGAIAGARWTF